MRGIGRDPRVASRRSLNASLREGLAASTGYGFQSYAKQANSDAMTDRTAHHQTPRSQMLGGTHSMSILTDIRTAVANYATTNITASITTLVPDVQGTINPPHEEFTFGVVATNAGAPDGIALVDVRYHLSATGAGVRLIVPDRAGTYRQQPLALGAMRVGSHRIRTRHQVPGQRPRRSTGIQPLVRTTTRQRKRVAPEALLTGPSRMISGRRVAHRRRDLRARLAIGWVRWSATEPSA